jgi:predicted O-linked N-acetylglucosamine transferase (SPINDLY family)
MNCTDDAWLIPYRRGIDWFSRGFVEKAIEAFNNAINMNPYAAVVYHDIGIVLFLNERFEEAFVSFEKAVALDRQMTSAWLNGGNALCAMNRFEEAVQWIEQVLKMEPDHVHAHYNLGNIHKTTGAFEQALTCYQRTLAIEPSNVDAHNNAGIILMKQGMLGKALDCFTTALAFNPGCHQASYNAATAMQRLGHLEPALNHVRQTLQIQPGFGDALALYVSLLQQACDWDALSGAEKKLEKLTLKQLRNHERPSEQPFLSFVRSADPERNLQVAVEWSRWLISKWKGRACMWRHQIHKRMRRSITIGYMSEQFRNAATAHLTAGLFKRHDRGKFKIIAYSWGEDDGSDFRRNIERDVDQFVDIRNLSDEAAARRIYEDEVDILIDLMGWMHGHRMGILLQRPAPVQVNYLGYPGTTGAPFIDYLLSDRIVTPTEHHDYYTEKVITLPNCYQATDCNPAIGSEAITRSSMGLPQNRIVFCAFSTDYKIEARVFDCWMDILRQVPGSVLWLIVRSRLTRHNLRRQAQKGGVDHQRLVFTQPLSKAEHLARIKLADIALDTFTVNGHTTTSDTLWAGVPVVTLMGTHFASRVASSILTAIGLNELVTHRVTDYKALAVKLALNPNRLAAVKAKLEINRAGMPLYDTDRFVRSLEQAYRRMWDRYISGQKAASFIIEEHESL